MAVWDGIRGYIRLVVWGKRITLGTPPADGLTPQPAPVIESVIVHVHPVEEDPKQVRREIMGLHASLTVLTKELDLIQGE